MINGNWIYDVKQYNEGIMARDRRIRLLAVLAGFILLVRGLELVSSRVAWIMVAISALYVLGRRNFDPMW
jgi:hypothetical protein